MTLHSAHKNVKLFITHGGMGSVVESKFNGVPIIGIPFFGDQMGNVAAAVEEGWALHVDFADISEATLLAAIDEILTNPKYTLISIKEYNLINYGFLFRYLKTIQSISTLYRDRPMSALDTATYWIEYVIRHKGAPHMRFPGIDMNFFQNHSLDVIAFLAIVIYLVCKLISFLVKFLCCSSKSKVGSNKKFNNKKLKTK
jgi:glucuronosyltransferase